MGPRPEEEVAVQTAPRARFRNLPTPRQSPGPCHDLAARFDATDCRAMAGWWMRVLGEARLPSPSRQTQRQRQHSPRQMPCSQRSAWSADQ